MPALACTPHDHSQCVSSALAEAEQLCSSSGLRLTSLRRRVLELVLQNRHPLGAYEILAMLSEQDGRKAAPPTVYRALDFLQKNHLVHKIASLNAFIGCTQPRSPHQGQFLICRQCHGAIELKNSPIQQAITGAAAAEGFWVESATVEMVGLCNHCQEMV